MDIRHQPDGSLLLTQDCTRWTNWLIGTTPTLAVIGIMLLEQARFRFDAAGRMSLTDAKPRVDEMRATRR